MSIGDTHLSNSEARKLRHFLNKNATKKFLGVLSEHAPREDSQQASAPKIEILDCPAEHAIEIEFSNGNVLDIVHVKDHILPEEVAIAFYESREQEKPAALLQFPPDRMRQVAKVIDDIIA